MQKPITKMRLPVTDNVYRYASKKDYYTCAEKAFSQAFSLLEGKKTGEKRYLRKTEQNLPLVHSTQGAEYFFKRF